MRIYRCSVTGSPVRTVFQRYLVSLIAALFLLGLPAPSARAQVVYDSGGFTPSAWSDMTTFALADNFTSAGSISFNAIRFWASSPGRGSTLSTFSGTLSYFIRASLGALPGNVIPDAVLASGTVSGAEITQTDTGVLNGAGDASSIIQLDFAIPQITLPAGIYWLQLKEGTIDSPADGSILFWQSNTQPTIFPQTRADSDEVNPVLWNHIPGGNQAFQLRNVAVSAAAPEPTSLVLAVLPLAGGLVVRRRKTSRRRVVFLPRSVSSIAITALTILSLAVVRPAHAQVLFGNFGVGTDVDPFTGSTLTDEIRKTVRFSTGTNGVTITSVQATMARSGQPGIAAGGIYSNDINGNAGTLLSGFAPIELFNDFPTTLDITFTPTSAIVLAPNTSYHLYLTGSGNPFGIKWYETSPTGTAPIALNGSGIVFEDYRVSLDAGQTWGASSVTNRFQINGTVGASAVAPEPTPLTLIMIGSITPLCWRRRRR